MFAMVFAAVMFVSCSAVPSNATCYVCQKGRPPMCSSAVNGACTCQQSGNSYCVTSGQCYMGVCVIPGAATESGSLDGTLQTVSLKCTNVAALKSSAAIARQQGWLRVAALPQTLGKVSPFLGSFVQGLQRDILSGALQIEGTRFHGIYQPNDKQWVEFDAEWDANKILFVFKDQGGLEREYNGLLISREGDWILSPKGSKEAISNLPAK